MGLLFIGVLAGILIGFGWFAPSRGYFLGCGPQPCFDRVEMSRPAEPKPTALKPDPAIAKTFATSVRSAERSSAKKRGHVGLTREVTGDVTVEPGNRLDSQAWAPAGSDTLGRFGDWIITKKDSVITLHSDTGNLAVRCSDATITYVAFIRISDPRSIAGRPEAKPPPNYNFTAWADSNEPADFTFLVPYASAAYATGIVFLNPKFADQNTKFWAMLKSARSRFSYNTSTGTISVNAVDLSPAIARFQDECFKIFKANAHHRLDEPIPLDWLRR
ncbi:hypothetical protein [Bradyrhizobium sp. AS23.2]|uniref:hypothetical protein n=1 Tax=Bradyrhizobium sp. AS23.2 TaxID=1680155 RepID=UPI0009405515|nr:hypothetical protein [Bradyrhizobium sp. AS23.2]OKO75629.1 hypothetical protein AC630_24140 [Bradyrhizobium sp. AS23.2]